MGITVAVTGPTGEIGMSAVAALEREPEVDRILGMARRPFDPDCNGWHKVEYRRGDILDRDAVDALVAEADVVVHLAFVIMGSRAQTRRVNLLGSHNVFEATITAARPRRLVYTSSLAVYGYHRDNPVPLTEDVPPRGSPEHYYSQDKAECEAMLTELALASDIGVYVLRPCIVAGPKATILADVMPWNRLGRRASRVIRTVGRVSLFLRPVFPDPGVPVQLVHHDDVAAAVAAAALGRGAPGAYNIAGDGVISVSDVANAVGGHGIRVPHLAVLLASEALARLPLHPAIAEWVHVARTPMIMDTGKAKRELGWQPRYTSRQTLQAMAAVV